MLWSCWPVESKAMLDRRLTEVKPDWACGTPSRKAPGPLAANIQVPGWMAVSVLMFVVLRDGCRFCRPAGRVVLLTEGRL